MTLRELLIENILFTTSEKKLSEIYMLLPDELKDLSDEDLWDVFGASMFYYDNED